MAGTSFSAGQTTGSSGLKTAQLDRGTSASAHTRIPSDPCGYARMRSHARPSCGYMSWPTSETMCSTSNLLAEVVEGFFLPYTFRSGSLAASSTDKREVERYTLVTFPKALKVLVPLWELFLYSSPFFRRSVRRVVAAAGDTPKKVLIASGVRNERFWISNKGIVNSAAKVLACHSLLQ